MLIPWNASPIFRSRQRHGLALTVGVLGLVAASYVPVLYGDPPTMPPSKIVIAHRGASGYLPEHSLASKALAYAMGADYLEQDCVMTADGQVIVLHDVHLDTVCDVANRFPGRARDDGRFYAIDFTLAEIETLRLHERTRHDSGERVYPQRFPAGSTALRIPTLREEIQLIHGLNQSTGKRVGIYPEIKQPAWHRRQGHDISVAVLDILRESDYTDKTDPVFVQCFDPRETRRLREELKCPLRLIQLIGENSWDFGRSSDDPIDFAPFRRAVGLQQIAEYADGIGPSWKHLVEAPDSPDAWQASHLVRDSHQAGLLVHPYTFRADELPPHFDRFEDFVQSALFALDVDGVFTDFPDRAVRVRDASGQ